MSDDNLQQVAEACVNALFSRDKASQALGMTVEQVAPGSARVSMSIKETMLNGHATCHGGFIFALADSCFAFACNSYNENTVASGCSIDYVQPARLGDRLTAIAQLRSRAGRTGLYDVTLVNQVDEVVAHFRGRSYRLQGQVVALESG